MHPQASAQRVPASFPQPRVLSPSQAGRLRVCLWSSPPRFLQIVGNIFRKREIFNHAGRSHDLFLNNEEKWSQMESVRTVQPRTRQGTPGSPGLAGARAASRPPDKLPGGGVATGTWRCLPSTRTLVGAEGTWGAGQPHGGGHSLCWSLSDCNPATQETQRFRRAADEGLSQSPLRHP